MTLSPEAPSTGWKPGVPGLPVGVPGLPVGVPGLPGGVPGLPVGVHLPARGLGAWLVLVGFAMARICPHWHFSILLTKMWALGMGS